MRNNVEEKLKRVAFLGELHGDFTLLNTMVRSGKYDAIFLLGLQCSGSKAPILFESVPDCLVFCHYSPLHDPELIRDMLVLNNQIVDLSGLRILLMNDTFLNESSLAELQEQLHYPCVDVIASHFPVFHEQQKLHSDCNQRLFSELDALYWVHANDNQHATAMTNKPYFFSQDESSFFRKMNIAFNVAKRPLLGNLNFIDSKEELHPACSEILDNLSTRLQSFQACA